MLRQAQIAQYINLLYEDIFQDWSRKHSAQLPAIARHAYALTDYRRCQICSPDKKAAQPTVTSQATGMSITNASPVGTSKSR